MPVQWNYRWEEDGPRLDMGEHFAVYDAAVPAPNSSCIVRVPIPSSLGMEDRVDLERTVRVIAAAPLLTRACKAARLLLAGDDPGMTRNEVRQLLRTALVEAGEGGER